MSQKFKSEIELQSLNNATTDTDKFLVSDSGVVKYRTGNEVLSDLGITLNTASKLQHQVKAGVAINKGQAVYVTSADGTNMIVGLASNASEATSSKTMGLLDATVAINGFANVVTEGLLDGLNTVGANAGDPVWLGTGGNLIYGLLNKPYAPAHLVFIGIVTRVNANNGEIFVKVQNGFELNEIHDVDLKTTTPVNGHLLGFNGTLWVNKTIAGWLGYTPANANGTTNYVSKFTSATTLGNSQIFDNGTNVGIGTTSPSEKLHISGNTLVTGTLEVDTVNNGVGDFLTRTAGGIVTRRTAAEVRSDIGAQAALTNPVTGTGTLNFVSKFTSTGSTLGNSQIFDNGTNVGIGTASPVDKLDVNGSMRFRANTPNFTAVTNSGVIDFVPTTVFPTDPQIRFCAVGTATVGASIVFQTGTTSASIGEVMRITSTGNVGIGTTVPAVRLNVAGGDAAFDFGGFANIPAAKLLKAGDEPTLRFYRPSGGTPNARIFQIQNTVGDLTFGYALANKYSESTFTEAMRITSVGNVGIGTTAPQRALQVGGFSGNPEICIGSGTTGLGSLIFGDGASGNNPWRGFVQYNHATDAMIIGTANASWLTLTNGGALGLNVNPTNTAGRFEASNDIVAFSSSDKRWKTNIKNIDSPLEKISQINGVEFDWIEDEPVHGNKGHDIGVIAQEIEKILPDAVQTRESGMKAVKYEKVIPLLIEAVKEQQKQIDELKSILNGNT